MTTTPTKQSQQSTTTQSKQQSKPEHGKRRRPKKSSKPSAVQPIGQPISIEQLFGLATPVKQAPLVTTPRGKMSTPPARRTPTSTNYATPAYADSPKASELPPPPKAWLQTSTPQKPSSSPKFTGLDLIRQVALVAQ